MPNTTGGGSSPRSPEKNLPIALGLMLLVLIVSQYLFKPQPGPKPVKPIDDKKTAAVVQPPPVTPMPQTAGAPAAGSIQASAEQVNDIDTDLFHIVFTNRGGVVKSWVLKRYRDDQGHPLQLVDQQAFENQATHIPLPFSIEVKEQRITTDPNNVLYQVQTAQNAIEFNYSDGHTTIHKSFHFDASSYLCEIQSSVAMDGAPVAHFLEWRGGFGDAHVFHASASERTVWYDASNSKLIQKSYKDAKNGPFNSEGNYTFAGLEDTFFAAVALPRTNSIEVRTYSDDVKLPKEDKPQQFVGDGIATGNANNFSLFVGPKDIDILKTVNPKLSQLIDWGFFGIISKPIFLWLNWTHDHWTNNYGWAIVVLTLIINFALLPLRFTSLKSSRKMQRIAPQVKAINEKYKNIKFNDPRKAEQNQEVMALYKKEGINPVGGCLPMLVQLPFLWAFYRVLGIAIELRHAPWLWVTDLSQPETLPIHLLPIILIATQFLMQKMTPTPGVDPNQQKMMLIMPLFMGYIFYGLSSGLVLYYLTSNLVGIVQQLVINRMMPAPTPVPEPSKAPVKRTVKK